MVYPSWFSQGPFADPWIIPLIQGYVEVRQVPVLTGQASDVSQGLYHLEGRYRKKDSDLDLTAKVGGGKRSSIGEERPPSAMIEMTEMVRRTETEDDLENSLKGKQMAKSRTVHVWDKLCQITSTET